MDDTIIKNAVAIPDLHLRPLYMRNCGSMVGLMKQLILYRTHHETNIARSDCH